MPEKKKNKKRSWRKAARKVMFEATQAEAEKRYGTREPIFNYRWEHVTAVVTLAIKLAQLTGADQDVVEAAAWLHDIRKDAGNNHHRQGAKFARKFLQETNFPTKKIDQVAHVIQEHMGLYRDKPLQNLEAQILWDADKLAKIGLTAAFHWLGGDLARGKPHTTTDFVKNGRDVNWQKKTVKSMHTKPARRAAKARLKAYNQLWKQLESELNGDDLKEG
jgi:uncharacterized protein